MSSTDKVMIATNIVDGVPCCKCALPTKRHTSNTAANPNRDFFKCPVSEGGCKYFKWYDDIFNNDGTAKSGATGVTLVPAPSSSRASASATAAGSAPTSPTKPRQSAPATPKSEAAKRRYAAIQKAQEEMEEKERAVAQAKAAGQKVKATTTGKAPAKNDDDDEEYFDMDMDDAVEEELLQAPKTSTPTKASGNFRPASVPRSTTDEGSPRKRPRSIANNEDDLFTTPPARSAEAGPSSSRRAPGLLEGVRSTTEDEFIAGLNDLVREHLRQFESQKVKKAERIASVAQTKAAALEAELELERQVAEELRVENQGLKRRLEHALAQVSNLRMIAKTNDSD